MAWSDTILQKVQMPDNITKLRDTNIIEVPIFLAQHSSEPWFLYWFRTMAPVCFFKRRFFSLQTTVCFTKHGGNWEMSKKNGDWYSIDMRLIYLPNPTFSQVQNFGHRKHEMLPLYLHHLTYLLQKNT